MTAKQKANRERFKKVVAEAKKLRKKNPKLSQAQAVKQAWAIMYSKTGTSKKVGAVKKKAAKKAIAKNYHKDTKSHNVNIRVMSGIGAIKHQASEYLKGKYGHLAAKKLLETTKRGKKKIQKEMSEIASKIKKVSSL